MILDGFRLQNEGSRHFMATKLFNKKIDLTNTLFLTLTPIAALFFISLHLMRDGLMLSQWILAVVFYFATGLAITAGYHRMFSHRAYKAHPIVEMIFLFFGAGAFQNSLLKWGTDHRRHHTKCDTDDDPYSIKKGFFYAHMGWICEADERNEIERWGKDLMKNPRVMFQHKHYLLMAITSGIILPTLLGGLFGSFLGGFALATWGRIVFVHHATFFINSLAHTWGKQTYGDDNTARDSQLVAFFSYGEGHHNYHHHFQADYRNGVRWFDFDPTKWLINALAFFGLAYDLIQTSEQDILAARLKMEQRVHPAFNESAQEILQRIKVQLKALKSLQEQYTEEKRRGARETVDEIKRRMKAEKRLLKENLELWRASFQGANFLTN